MPILFGELQGTHSLRFSHLISARRKICKTWRQFPKENALYLYGTAGKHLQTPSEELKNNPSSLTGSLDRDHKFFAQLFYIRRHLQRGHLQEKPH